MDFHDDPPRGSDGEQIGQPCASCGAELIDHFSGRAIAPDNPHGLTGCPEAAKQRALARTVADVLVTVLAVREGVVGARFAQLSPDVQQEYLTAANLALTHLGVIDARRI